MKISANLICAVTMLAALGAEPAVVAAETGKAPAAAATHDARMAWFREAKFGLFIHWGLYAAPAGEWQGRPVPGIGEWIMNRAKIPVRDYEKIAQGFDPEKFDAEAWVQLAADAGMKYVVFTAKHHDGFAMYDSAVSPYNIVAATPFKRDPIKELAAACARHGMPFGLYYSQAQDWHEPGGVGNEWDFPADEVKETSGAYDAYLRTKAEPQVRELLQNYGPLCLLWFDTPKRMTPERGQRFVDLVHQLQPATLIDGRLGSAGDYMSTKDNSVPDARQAGDWEVPATMNHTWGFKRDDTDWKSAGEIIFKLVDIVSKGGNYLLNVGPDATGVIPPLSQDHLRAVGGWLKIHGEAIYGAGRSPFGEEFGDQAAHLKDDAGRPLFLIRAHTWRCTVKPGKVYFTFFGDDFPRKGFDLPAFKNPIRRAYLLGDPDRRPLKILSTADGNRRVETGFPGPEAMANVLCLEILGDTVIRAPEAAQKE